MNSYRPLTWTRREALRGISAAAGAGLLGQYANPVAAEPPPETRSIRLMIDPAVPALCFAPTYVVKEFLHLEGFEDVQYVLYGEFVSDTEPLASDKADISPGFGSDFISKLPGSH
jgi:NitT/TauT family transport system substrate-binding protein